MKIARALLTALALVVAFAACDAHPTGPETGTCPLLGSGVGTC